MNNKPVSPKHFIFYFLIAAIHLSAILLGSGFETVVVLTKPLLLVALFVVYNRLSHGVVSGERKFMTGALVFSWLGDTTLLFQQKNQSFFLVGLVCFLLAHVCYIFAFLQTQKASPSLLRKHPWIILLFIGYAAIILNITYAGLGSMLAPVVIYMVVILIMGLSALNRFGKTSFISFAEVFIGALFFMLSDSLLAINKFSQPIPSASVIIMSTYIAAQYFIVKGMLDGAPEKKSVPV